MRVKPIKPFANESDSLAIADLTIENRTDRVQIYGSIHLTRDKAGLANARVLKQLLDDVVGALESDNALPNQITLTNAPRSAKDPFA
jgi:hypothetical protein